MAKEEGKRKLTTPLAVLGKSLADHQSAPVLGIFLLGNDHAAGVCHRLG